MYDPENESHGILVAEKLADAPTGLAGQMCYISNLGKFLIHDGTQWGEITNGSPEADAFDKMDFVKALTKEQQDQIMIDWERMEHYGDDGEGTLLADLVDQYYEANGTKSIIPLGIPGTMLRETMREMAYEMYRHRASQTFTITEL